MKSIRAGLGGIAPYMKRSKRNFNSGRRCSNHCGGLVTRWPFSITKGSGQAGSGAALAGEAHSRQPRRVGKVNALTETVNQVHAPDLTENHSARQCATNVVYQTKLEKSVRSKLEWVQKTGQWSRTMGLAFWIWGVAEVVDVAIGAEAADDGGAGRSVNGMALGADGDFAVVADADAGLLAPDVGPPRAVGGGTEDGAFFGEGLLVGGVGCLAEFAVDFVLVGVGHELVEEVVGPDQFDDVVGGQEGDEAFLPVVVAAFDFAFGLGRWGVEQLDAVEVEGLRRVG